MGRGPAVSATSVALALINIGLAFVIVDLVSAPLAPLWVALLLVSLGLLSAVAAVLLWRQYLATLRTSSGGGSKY